MRNNYSAIVKISLLQGVLYLTITIMFSLLSPSIKAMSEERKTELVYLLKQDCGSCHGMTLKGGLGPSLLKKQLEGKSKEFLAYTIANGRSGSAMPPWKNILSVGDIDFLVSYLLSEGYLVEETLNKELLDKELLNKREAVQANAILEIDKGNGI